ncbi:ADPATP carrier protein [Ecytonucleospora hepatopenaei]|uniref:ADPATP carrier protein n=1 Tax=Ecytonucleospora hepatopenaei TaxID=646526 RepID=A0A1W0E5H0_9MICR|nr:ADPATP carrier protein [Ecytonucleospora hepatopenaei]
MGNKLSLVYDKLSSLLSVFKSDKQVSLTILGLDAAGKTTLVNLLRGETLHTVPTIGFNAEEITIDKTTIRLWDVGGQTSIIVFWREYVKTTDGLIFVIDLADKDRFELAYNAFKQLTDDLRENIPVFLLLNKTDLLSSEEKHENVSKIKKLFNFDEQGGMVANGKKYRCKIMECSVQNEQKNLLQNQSYSVESSNIYSGFRWVMRVADGKEGF